MLPESGEGDMVEVVATLTTATFLSNRVAFFFWLFSIKNS
jgi:hypothetical protein